MHANPAIHRPQAPPQLPAFRGLAQAVGSAGPSPQPVGDFSRGNALQPVTDPGRAMAMAPMGGIDPAKLAQLAEKFGAQRAGMPMQASGSPTADVHPALAGLQRAIGGGGMRGGAY